MSSSEFSEARRQDRGGGGGSEEEEEEEGVKGMKEEGEWKAEDSVL